MAKASYQNSPRSSSAKLMAGAKIVNSMLPEGRKPASVLKNSKVFESMDKETATEFPPLFPESTTTPLVCGKGDISGGSNTSKLESSKIFGNLDSQGTNPTFSPPPGEAPSSLTHMAGEVERSHKAIPGYPDRIQIGPGKFFRPTKGLCALFSRTGTRRRPRVPPYQPPSRETILRRSFAEVVRVGKPMAAQGGGNGGGSDGRGGGRGGEGYNLGFNPGFNPGFGGRGRGFGGHQRGRARGYGYGGGHGGCGGYAPYGGYNDYDYGYHGPGHGRRPYGGRYVGRGRGWGFGGQRFHSETEPTNHPIVAGQHVAPAMGQAS